MQRRIAGFSLSDLLFFLLSLIYLVAEFRFNAVLLDAAGSASVDAAAIDHAADFGRVVSAFGFSLLALGLFTTARFRLTHRREKIAFGCFAAVCLTPFLFFPPEAEDMLFVVPVAFGLFLMLLSRGGSPFHTVLAVVLMAWPAMYAGQKSMIEHLVVEPTTWLQREHARNALMLKAGLEDCVVEATDQWLCKGDKSTAEIRAVRAMIAALWMHDPQAVMVSLSSQRESIIEKTVRKTGEETTAEAYKTYTEKMKAERGKVVDELIEKFYKPYQEASKLYSSTQNPQELAGQVDRIWREMETQTDRVWDEYRFAQDQYRDTVGRVAGGMLSREGLAFDRLEEFCATRNCSKASGMADRAAIRLQDEAEARFVRKTGFPPNVANKAELMSYPRAREAFETGVAERMAKDAGLSSFMLPANWVYDERYLKAVLTRELQLRARAQWSQKFGADLKPGLPMDEFFTAMKIPPVPNMQALVMSEQAFSEQYTLPTLRTKMRSTIDQMVREAPLYANGAPEEAKGKEYIRAVYIPAIALFLSLTIVLLTLMRGINAALRHGLQAAGEHGVAFLQKQGLGGQRRLRQSLMAGVLAVIALGPFMLSNSYTQAPAYQVYVAEARQQNIVTATLLDWAIHVQPVIYTVVKPFTE